MKTEGYDDLVSKLMTARSLAAGNSPNACDLYDQALSAIGELVVDRNQWRAAAQMATPEGSEYCNAQSCADHIWNLRRVLHETKCELARERRALAAEEPGA